MWAEPHMAAGDFHQSTPPSSATPCLTKRH